MIGELLKEVKEKHKKQNLQLTPFIGPHNLLTGHGKITTLVLWANQLYSRTICKKPQTNAKTHKTTQVTHKTCAIQIYFAHENT